MRVPRSSLNALPGNTFAEVAVKIFCGLAPEKTLEQPYFHGPFVATDKSADYLTDLWACFKRLGCDLTRLEKY